jgi:hypothetical protein
LEGAQSITIVSTLGRGRITGEVGDVLVAHVIIEIVKIGIRRISENQ